MSDIWNSDPKGGEGISSVNWGDILGTLSDQIDLQDALDLKLDIADFNLSTFDTGDLADSLDKRYVTDAQLVVIGNTSGVNTGDQTSIVGITGTKAQFNTALTDGDFLFVGDVTQYTDEMAQDAVGTILADSSEIDFTYTDATPEITAVLKTTTVSAASYGSSTSIPSFTVDSKGRLTAASGNAVIAPAGTLTGVTLASNVLASSLTSVGTLTGGATGAGFTIALGTSTLTGDLPFANLAQIAGFSILAKAGTGTGDVAALTAGTDSVLMRSGSGDLTFGTIVTNQITADAVTYAKIQNVSVTSRILGRITSGAGDIEELTAANVATIINASLDHGTLTGLGDDDHTQYALLAGRSGGQTLIGGTGTTDDLILRTTSGVGTTGSDMIFQGGNNGAKEFARFMNNGNFGIGISNPTQKFEIAAEVSAERGMAVAYYNDDVQAGNLNIRKARGTVASPTSVTAGITLGGFGMQGYGDTAGTGGFKNGGFIRVVAAENFSNTAAGSYMRFDTTPIGSTTLTERMRLTEAGNMKIAGSANRATTEGTNHLDIFDGTAPVGTLANGISLYSTAGELRVMDAAGNPTLLSPHDKDNNWIFDSYVGKGGNRKRIVVDMQKMMYFLNEHFGLDFIHEFSI